MSKEQHDQLEHLAIILEVIGFLFVTIDLYGRARLERLSIALRQIKLETLLIRGYKRQLILMLAVFIPFLPFYIVGLVNRSSISLGISGGYTGIVIKDMIEFFINFLLTFVVLRIAYIFFVIIVVPLVGLLLKRFPIEGVMLACGAALFIISKGILYSLV